MTGKLHIRTFGCPMNEYDSARMADVLAQSDRLEPTDRAVDADVIRFNARSVREKAQKRAFHALGRARELETVRTDNHRVVNVAGDPALAGRHVDLVVTAAHSLRGESAA